MLAAVLLDGLEPQACGVLQGLGYLIPQLAGVPSSQVRVEHVTTIQAIINQTSETETGKDLSMGISCIHAFMGLSALGLLPPPRAQVWKTGKLQP